MNTRMLLLRLSLAVALGLAVGSSLVIIPTQAVAGCGSRC